MGFNCSTLPSSGKLYFGDKSYGNQIVPMGLGGSGGGRLTVHSRHVDIDGYISADGLSPDSRSKAGAGRISFAKKLSFKCKMTAKLVCTY